MYQTKTVQDFFNTSWHFIGKIIKISEVAALQLCYFSMYRPSLWPYWKLPPRYFYTYLTFNKIRRKKRVSFSNYYNFHTDCNGVCETPNNEINHKLFNTVGCPTSLQSVHLYISKKTLRMSLNQGKLLKIKRQELQSFGQ